MPRTSLGARPVLVVNSGVSLADANIRRFILFRVFFNARYYYPVFGILFLDYGLTLGQISILNFAWALAIVGLEVPSGALADQFGRRPLMIGAAACMVVEMALLAFVPLGNPTLLFAVFLLNRLLSGAAEASASGADEALVFDSLVSEQRTPEWPRVLERLGRWSSFAFLFVMVMGAFVYDANLLHRTAAIFGFDITFNPKVTMRFPVYLTLVNAVLALVVTLRLEEPPSAVKNVLSASLGGTWALIRRVTVWLWRSPLALFLIAAGLLHDSIIRLVMTLASNYYRLIAIPTAWFGVIGAAFAIYGFFVPTLGRWLVERRSVGFNFGLLATLTFGGLLGLALRLPWFGVVFVVLLGVAMSLLTFFLSHYLNALVESSERATVLSFRGLAFNLGYGLVSVLFAWLLRRLSGSAPAGTSEEMIFAASLNWLPWYFLASLVPLVSFARLSGCLRAKAAASGKICAVETKV